MKDSTKIHNSIELKPCPVCGGKVSLHRSNSAYWIECCCGLDYHPKQNTVNQVVKAWNKEFELELPPEKKYLYFIVFSYNKDISCGGESGVATTQIESPHTIRNKEDLENIKEALLIRFPVYANILITSFQRFESEE